MKFSTDNVVSFNPDNHVYTNVVTGKKLESVTTYINRFKEPFNAEEQAVKFAEKRGLDPEKLLREWEVKGVESRTAGTAAHFVFENYFLTGRVESSGLHKKEETAVKIIKDFFLTKRLIAVYCEHIVYDEERAGQIDMVAKDRNNNHFILDWKTNNEIKTNGYGRLMKPPFDNMPDASFYHYSLQIKLYTEMIKEKIQGSWIVHLKENGYQFLKPFNLAS